MYLSVLNAQGKRNIIELLRGKISDIARAGLELRERVLMREFEEYRKSKQKRLKVFRLEAVRVGFKKARRIR